MAYYYLISSLPMLKADADMPLSYQDFLNLCKATLPEAKCEFFSNLTLSSSKGVLVDKWSKFYLTFTNELTYQRNLRLGKKVPPPSERSEDIINIVNLAINSKNPLLGEEILIKFQFEKLDEFVGTHYFDDYALTGYALKLKLLERKTLFNKEKGKVQFDGIIEKLEKDIITMK